MICLCASHRECSRSWDSPQTQRSTNFGRSRLGFPGSDVFQEAWALGGRAIILYGSRLGNRGRKLPSVFRFRPVGLSWMAGRGREGEKGELKGTHENRGWSCSLEYIVDV